MKPIASVRRGLLPVAAIGVAALLAACGGSASPSPSAATSVAASVAASTEPSVAASAEASAAGSNAAPSLAIPSGLHAAPDLEAQLPDVIAGETLQKLSFTGAAMAASGQDTADIQAALGAAGKSLNDLSFALAVGAKVQIGAYKLSGADAGQFLGLVVNAMSQDQGSSATDANKGGKATKAITGSSGTVYLYSHGELLYFVSGDDDAAVTEALSKLP